MSNTIKNKELSEKLQYQIDTKTKPIGALGALEMIALQIGLIQKTQAPQIKKPTLIVFAADHGIASKGEVNPYPQEVTAQMVLNFINGGAAINIFCKQHGIDLKIVDAGVNYDFGQEERIIHNKIAFGTKNYQEEPAMTTEQYFEALEKGSSLVESLTKNGSNCIGFGEMGIGNTSSAALLMSYFTKEPIENCTGAGTGLSPDGIYKKTQILNQVLQNYKIETPSEALKTFGGFEIVMITGAILKAADLRMTILIDGFIVTAALLGAKAIDKNCLDYCIFTHTSNESGHQQMLNFLEKKALLDLGLRLGEGTGVALAYPLVQSAVLFLNNMASFKDARVSTNT